MDLSEWEAKVQKLTRKYNHFDVWVSYERVKEYILNIENIEQHGFYPLIHFFMPKYKWKNGFIDKSKRREIYYAAHIDSWVYRYYSYKLNELYNTYVEKYKFPWAPVAYRTNLGLSNVDFAYNAFEFIRELQKQKEDCYVVIGDFTDFFDSLDHAYLKEQLLDLLGDENIGISRSRKLPKDYYNVFKNVTKYSYVDIEDILAYHKLEACDRNKRLLNKESFNGGRVLSMAKLRLSDKIRIHKHNNIYGIPQGTPISAVLANIYMIKWDLLLKEWVDSKNGFYQRYSDDFIIVIPKLECSKGNLEAFINNQVKSIPNLVLQPEKQKWFEVRPDEIINFEKILSENINSVKSEKTRINYLGFSFDGDKVSIRDKTISRYYGKMNKAIRSIIKQDGVTHPRNPKVKSKIIPLYRLYNQYTYKGTIFYRKYHRNYKHVQLIEQDKGNFHDYVLRAQKKFKNDESISDITTKSIRHLLKRFK